MSWPLIPISYLGKVATGKTPSKAIDNYFGGDIPFVTPTELDRSPYVFDSIQTLTEAGADQIKLVPKDSVMVCCIGSLGKIGIAGRELATNQQINSVIFDEEKIFPKYGYYALSRLKPEMEKIAPSTTVAIINKSRFEAMTIPVPPLLEQKRIAAILDKADNIRRKRQQAIKLADEFLRAVFLDMFGDPVTNPKGWPIGTIRELATSVSYGTSEKAHETIGEFPVLRMMNITYEGKWDFTSLKYIDLDEKGKEKYLVFPGDLLFNRTNSKELVGKTAVYESTVPMAYAGYLVRLRTNERANPHYIAAYLNSAHGKMTLLNMCKSIVGMANINAQELQDIKICIPPIELQNKFAAITSAARAHEKRMADTHAEMDALFQSLSQKAFSGQL